MSCFCFHANNCQCVDCLNQQKDYLKSQKKHKTEEIPVISLSDTDANPGTVMIEALDAGIAVITMRGPWRSIYATIFTVLDAKTMSLNRNGKYFGLFRVSSLSEWRYEWNDRQLLLLKIRKYFGQDAWIDFAKHNHRHLHSYIETNTDTKKWIK